MRFARAFGNLVVTIAVFAVSLGPVERLLGAGEDVCSGHVCQCVRHCPPKRAAGSGCHDRADARPVCEMRGTCRHDRATASIDGGAWLCPEPGEAETLLDARPHASANVALAVVGFLRIEKRPPRA